MVDEPEEVTPLVGDEGNNILFVTAATYEDWYAIFGEGGDDVIVRDRTGRYDIYNGHFGDLELIGGDYDGSDTGFDIVSYASSAYALSANLAQGIAQSQTPNHWPVSLGTDWLDGIEGVIGSGHNDHIIGSSVANKLWAHDGNDALWGEGGNDRLWGMQGNDTVYGGDGVDELYGDGGADRLRGNDGVDLLRGGDQNDDLEGGDQNDSLYGDNHNDDLDGGAGNDWLDGGAGNDLVKGGSGNDRIRLGSGNDVVDGGSQTDTIEYTSGNLLVNLYGGTVTRSGGSDQISNVENVVTAGGNDVVFGTSGVNDIRTYGGNDTVYTLGGSDYVWVGTGNDNVIGYGGGETMYGDTGNDTLRGNDGKDTILGGADRDLIDGGDVGDQLYGGADADVFRFEAGDNGIDFLRDFVLGQDTLAFGAGYFEGQSDPDFDVTEVLYATNNGGGDVALRAVTSWSGLEYIGIVLNVSLSEVRERIANGTIFDVETNDFGGPDGLEVGL